MPVLPANPKYIRFEKILRIASMLLVVILVWQPGIVFARAGDNGFEGGISSGYVEGRETFEYKEVVFVTGKPVLFTGTLTIKKTVRQGEIRSTYTYNLQNAEHNATLRRSAVYDTAIEEKGSQVIEKTVLSRTPSESIVISGTVYNLQSIDFSRSNIIDKKVAVNYFAGNVWSRKVYSVAGTGARITVELNGELYGYEQYWGTTETGKYNIYYQYEDYTREKPEIWGGSAVINISSNTSKSIEYIENIPNQISFDGGFIETQHNTSVLEYRYEMPEFDKDGISTDNLIKGNGFANLETYPVQSRLRVPNINHLRGHWAYKDIMTLYSLEVFQGDEAFFKPEKYITRAEFADAIIKAARKVPEEQASQRRTTTTRRRTVEEEKISPFVDVPKDHAYFESIYEAYERGLMSGTGTGYFYPDATITTADALCIFIRALGLENLGPGDVAVTVFRDNDQIPGYARNAAYVAKRIGLVEGDSRGYLNPNENLTKGRAAAMLNRFINYMREDIKVDYTKSIIGF